MSTAEAHGTEATETPDGDAGTLRVLLVEDDENLRAGLAALVGREQASCQEAGSLDEARKRLAGEAYDAALIDLTLPDGSGLDLMDSPDVLGTPEYIVITGDGSAQSAVDALKRGALDYLTKPVDRGRLRSVLANVRRTQALRSEVTGLRDSLRELGRFGSLVGRSAVMQQVYQLIERVAPTDASVFVTGESGTGKELVAETVHMLSRRAKQPFLAVNCGAMSPAIVESELFGHEKGAFTGADKRRQGFFERANGGTLFLDEITEMPLEHQVNLLRVLEVGAVRRVGASDSIPVDVRVIAAANRDPAEAVSEGALREDLFYRLNVFPIDLPALRDREGDVALLAEHFLSKVNERDGVSKRFTPRALAKLEESSWSGNVRELKNVVERAAILADDVIDLDNLPGFEDGAGEAPEEGTSDDGSTLTVRVGASLESVEKRMILATLEAQDGNKKKTAELLGISLKTLYNRLNVYAAEDGTES